MFGNEGLSVADIAAVTKDNNDGFGGNNGWWLLIILFALFGWGGNGYGWGGNAGRVAESNTSVYEGYVLGNDFSQLSRQLSDSTAMTERKLDGINNGICSLGYDQLAQMNGINSNIMSVGNAIQTQLADCCCKTQQNIKDTQYVVSNVGADISRSVERGFADSNYNLATQANGIQTAIANGFCQTNFNAQTNTRDIVDSQNAGTQAILARIDALESSRKDEKIAELQAKNFDLRLAASQQAQNNYLVDAIRPCPSPAYVVPNPFGCNCGYNNGCGQNYGTTIA